MQKTLENRRSSLSQHSPAWSHFFKVLRKGLHAKFFHHGWAENFLGLACGKFMEEHPANIQSTVKKSSLP